MVVGVKPEMIKVRVLLLELNVLGRLPFFHLRRRNIDTIRLATTAHGKVFVNWVKVVLAVSLGDGLFR